MQELTARGRTLPLTGAARRTAGPRAEGARVALAGSAARVEVPGAPPPDVTGGRGLEVGPGEVCCLGPHEAEAWAGGGGGGGAAALSHIG